MSTLPLNPFSSNDAFQYEFEKLLRSYKRTIYRQIRIEVRDFNYQEDLFQEVSFRLFRGNVVARIKSGAIRNPFVFIKKITKNVIRDFQKKKKKDHGIKFVSDLAELEGLRERQATFADDGESYLRYLAGLKCIQEKEGLHPVSDALILYCETDRKEGESFKILRIPSSYYYRFKDRVKRNFAFQSIFKDRV